MSFVSWRPRHFVSYNIPCKFINFFYFQIDIRTYAVLPMGSRWGLIQWIDNLEPLKGIVNDLLTDQGKPSVIVSDSIATFITFLLELY